MRQYPFSSPFASLQPETGSLSELTAFGSNPGALGGWLHVPETLPVGAPLVVAMHGCTQTAAGFGAASGWLEAADLHGFAVLLPEQRRGNNGNLCFNWFEPGDIARDRGETLSIRQMVDAAVARHRLDKSRVFVTGLSAGGAMAAAMLACHPDVFAGAGIVAGLPYGVAASVQEAMGVMRGQGLPPEADLRARLDKASEANGKPPLLSIWHGGADMTVALANAAAIAAQWRGRYDLPPAGATRLKVDGVSTRKVWSDRRGRDVMELVVIDGMGHGAPVNPAEQGGGKAAPFMLDVGVSSALEMARFWGIAKAAPRASATQQQASPVTVEPKSVETVIREALTKAGLL